MPQKPLNLACSSNQILISGLLCVTDATDHSMNPVGRCSAGLAFSFSYIGGSQGAQAARDPMISILVFFFHVFFFNIFPRCTV